MKIVNTEKLFNYLKDLHILKSKEVGDILQLSESVINYYAMGKRNPKNVDFILNSFYFKNFANVETFNRSVSRIDETKDIEDFNYFIFENNVWVDLSESPKLREIEFGVVDFDVADAIYAWFKENESNCLFGGVENENGFDAFIEQINAKNNVNAHTGRVRFSLLNNLEADEHFTNIKNVGYSLSSNNFTGMAMINSNDIHLNTSLERE